jgi:hypothetical protein
MTGWAFGFGAFLGAGFGRGRGECKAMVTPSAVAPFFSGAYINHARTVPSQEAVQPLPSVPRVSPDHCGLRNLRGSRQCRFRLTGTPAVLRNGTEKPQKDMA